MPKQIGNLEVPKLFETWDNPLWVGEEADKYRNVVKSPSVQFADEIMSTEDFELWRSCERWSVDKIYLKMKYGMWADDMEMQFIPEDKIDNVKMVKEMLMNETNS